MSDKERQITIQQTVIVTLRLLGVDSGLVSYNKARKIWGARFTKAVESGELRPLSVGEGKNGKRTYDIQDIIAKLA